MRTTRARRARRTRRAKSKARATMREKRATWATMTRRARRNRETRTRRRIDEDEEVEEEEGASPPRQVEVCSPNPLLAARRLLRDPKELLASIATEERRGEVAPARFNFSYISVSAAEKFRTEIHRSFDQVKLLETGRSCLWPRD